MRKLLVCAFAFLALGGCAAETPSANTPANAPPGQWSPNDPAMGNGPNGAPGALQANGPGAPAQPTQPAPAAQSPWGALFPFPGFSLPSMPGAPPPAAPPASPPPPAAPGAQPTPQAAPPFPLPPGFPALPVPSSLPSIPGLPAMWPQGAPALPLPQQGLPGTRADVAQRCVDDINGYRATKGLAPLARWADGEACAADEARQDSQSQRPHGSFGACRESAQNACPNWSGTAERMTDDCLKMMWAEGPGAGMAHGHYNNMVDTRASKVACGTFTMPDGRLWAVQDFQ
jgi:hypothetical protein